MSVLFEAGAYFYVVIHLSQQESAGESKTSATAQVHLLFQLFCSFINKYTNSTLSTWDEAKSSVGEAPRKINPHVNK